VTLLFAAAQSADLSLWTGIASAIFYVLLIAAFGPKLVGALRRRQQGIVTELDRADVAKAEVDRVRQRYDAEIARVQSQAQEMIAEGKRDAAVMRDQLVAQARAEIDRIRARTTREIGLAQHAASVEIYRAAADKAYGAASRTLKAELNSGDRQSLADKALAELETALGSAKA
jgi:F-type H+-transporting ATPase subunit b